MLVDRNGLAQALDLEQLAFDHRLREFDEGVEDSEVALLHGNFKGLHVEPVACEHALGIAPLRVGRRTSAPCLGFVDDVVVNECGGVDDLNDRTQLDGALACVVQQLTGQTAAVQDGDACHHLREGTRRSR